jgi:hypothetical protein
MLKTFARVLAVGAFVIAAAIPTTAAAAGGPGVGLTVTIGSPITLTDRLLVTIPVTVTCTPPLANPVQFGDVFVTVEQADGKSVSHGSGSANLTSCGPQTFTIQVTPDLFPTTSGPFHGGPAVAVASATACDTQFTCVGGSSGAVSIRL